MTRLRPGDGLRSDDVEQAHDDDDEHREALHPRGAAVGDGFARVAAERHGDHRGDDRVRRQEQPRDDAREVAVAEALADVFEQSACRREPRAELGERVALQHRDDARDHERQPDGRAGDLAGRAEEREDPGADHRADADERRLPDGQPFERSTILGASFARRASVHDRGDGDEHAVEHEHDGEERQQGSAGTGCSPPWRASGRPSRPRPSA